MKALDRLLQRWRIEKARPYLKPGSRVLDIGCADGALFKQFGSLVAEGLGIDPHLETEEIGRNYRLMPGSFPSDFKDSSNFDAITMFAMLEHVKAEEQLPLAKRCASCLRPGGHLVISVPSPSADRVLDILKFFRVLDGMDLDQHHGFEVEQTTKLFQSVGLSLVMKKRFQLGFNNLFVFRKDLNSSETASSLPIRIQKLFRNILSHTRNLRCYASFFCDVKVKTRCAINAVLPVFSRS